MLYRMFALLVCSFIATLGMTASSEQGNYIECHTRGLWSFESQPMMPGLVSERVFGKWVAGINLHWAMESSLTMRTTASRDTMQLSCFLKALAWDRASYVHSPRFPHKGSAVFRIGVLFRYFGGYVATPGRNANKWHVPKYRYLCTGMECWTWHAIACVTIGNRAIIHDSTLVLYFEN